MPDLRSIFSLDKREHADDIGDPVNERNEQRISSFKKSISSPLISTLRTSFSGSTWALFSFDDNDVQNAGTQPLGQLARPFRRGYSLRPESSQIKASFYRDADDEAEVEAMQEEVSRIRCSLRQDERIPAGRAIGPRGLPPGVGGVQPWMRGDTESVEHLGYAASFSRSPSRLTAQRQNSSYGSGPPRSRYGLVVNEAALASRVGSRSAIDGDYPFRTDSLFAPHSKVSAPATEKSAADLGGRWPFINQPVVPPNKASPLPEGGLKNSPSLEVLMRLCDVRSEVPEEFKIRSLSSSHNASTMPSSSDKLDSQTEASRCQGPSRAINAHDQNAVKPHRSRASQGQDQALSAQELRGFDYSATEIRPLAESIMTRMRHYLAQESLSYDMVVNFVSACQDMEEALQRLDSHKIETKHVMPDHGNFKEVTALLLARHNLAEKELVRVQQAYRKLMKVFEDFIREQTVTTRTCIICADEKRLLEFPSQPPSTSCQHQPNTCISCLETWLSSELTSKGPTTPFNCPECPSELSHNDMKRCASKQTFNTYDTLKTRSALSSDPTFAWCLAPTCSSGQLNPEANNHHMRCVACGYEQCLHHRTAWHRGETCAQFDRRATKSQSDDRKTQAMLDSISKLCPNSKCGWRIQKYTGCDAMKCSRCTQKFCWQCLVPQEKIARLGGKAHGRNCKYYAKSAGISWPFDAHLD